MAPATVDWDAYLAEFHAERPGITEAVLSRCTFEQGSPYEWLTEGLDPLARHLDLACGSGPTRHPTASRWVGLDRAADELRAAARLGRRPLVRADMAHLPVAAGSLDVVTCSMALMLADPVEDVLDEIRRGLDGTGELRLLLPTRSPLTVTDRIRYLRLFWAARSPTRFPPTEMRRSASRTLGGAGFDVIDDQRRRFALPIADATEATRFISSWYLPGLGPERLAAAQRQAGAMAPFTVGVPLRRIVARPR